MATHSTLLAWRIPWTEEPGGLQSISKESDMTEVTWHARTEENTEGQRGPVVGTERQLSGQPARDQPVGREPWQLTAALT